MSTFFQSFPLIDYNFGDEIAPSLFQNLSVYIDLIDQIAEDGLFYENYTILDGERPDTVSYKLYGTTDYYWTFFLLNDHIRQQGWPLSVQEIYSYSRLYYPNVVISTEEITDLFRSFKRGDVVTQGNLVNPTAKGSILERNLDLGQLTVKPTIEVRDITVVNGGGGYTSIPNVTITGGGGSGALATAVIDSNGVISSIVVTDGGADFVTTPTVTVAAPKTVNWANVSSTTLSVVNGTITSGPYYNFLTTTVSGFQRGDVNNNGLIDSNDAAAFGLFETSTSDLTEDQYNKILRGIRPAIIDNYLTLPAWSKGPGTTATATAVLSSNSFAENTLLSTSTGVANNRLWNLADIENILTTTVVNQWDAIHHYENTSGVWVDIDPFNVDSSVSGLIPITNFERLQQINDDLRVIKVLKPNVAVQVYSEFQRLLRNER